MLTPIRVRGKNTRDQSRKARRKAIENGSSTKPRGRPLKLAQPATSHPGNSTRSSIPPTASMTSTTKRRKLEDGRAPRRKSKKQLSLLESLPVELLQSIFLYSLNLQLALTSPYIAAALSNEYVYTELILVAFAGVCTRAPEGAGDARLIYEPLHPQLSSAAVQTTIMSRRWFTLKLVRKCEAIFAQQIVQTERNNDSRQIVKTEANGGHLPSDDPQLPLVDDTIHYADGTSKTISTVHDFSGQQVQVYTEDPSSEFESQRSLTNWWTYVLPNCKANSWRDENAHVRIPEKLLHGPWSEEKMDLLDLLCWAGATVDWVNTSAGEVAERGLEQAILERNTRAISLLVHAPIEDYPPRGCVGVTVSMRHMCLAIVKAGNRQDIINALICHPRREWDQDDVEFIRRAFKARSKGDKEGQHIVNMLTRSLEDDFGFRSGHGGP